MCKKTVLLIILTCSFNLFLFNCKESRTSPKNNEQRIDQTSPGFYNINFTTLFTKKDSHAPNDLEIKKLLNTYFTKVWEEQKSSGGIIVARGNNVLLEKYTGYANIEEKTPITSTTPMHVASVSKVLTSLAILKLVEADKLDLSQKVDSFLPSFPYPEITIHSLLTHRSGLPNYAYVIDEIKSWDKSKRLSNEDILNLFAEYKPAIQWKHDSHFSYSNTNFALLALIVEKITNKSFPEALEQMIFKPLGMNHSYILQEKDLPHATPSYYANEKLFELNHLDLIYGDKNLYTTPRDLLRLSQAMYAPNFLRKDLLEHMFTPYSNEKPGVKNYGLGMRIMVFDNGKKIVYHTGWWHGSNAIFIHLLDEKVTIIAIGNKLSKAMYSSLRLSSLFGDYPLEAPDSIENDSISSLSDKAILNHKTSKNKTENSAKSGSTKTDKKKLKSSAGL
ncbi:MAG: beta-lactamase family protein [Flavobacteriaceae bacterium]|jgi:CubicO group peptidase (beta-lactamase class C family)|nr:beta-lactamase family protein [Flavobacteriaceae bacterium]